MCICYTIFAPRDVNVPYSRRCGMYNLLRGSRRPKLRPDTHPLESGGFWQTTGLEWMDGLAACAFDQVVDGGADVNPAVRHGARAELCIVGGCEGRALVLVIVQYFHKGRIGVRFLIYLYSFVLDEHTLGSVCYYQHQYIRVSI